MTDRIKYRTRYDADIAVANISAGDSDQVVTDYYNAADVSPDSEIVATREQLRGAINIDEFRALDAAARDAVRLVLLSETITVKGSKDRVIILNTFTATTGPNTRTNLAALETEIEAAVSRTRAQRGGILGNSLSVSVSDTSGMRAM